MTHTLNDLKVFGKYDDPVNLIKCLSHQIAANRLYRLDNQFSSLSIISIMRLASIAPRHLIAKDDLTYTNEYELCAWNPSEDVVGQCEQVVAAIQAHVPVQTFFQHLLYKAGKVYLIGG